MLKTQEATRICVQLCTTAGAVKVRVLGTTSKSTRRSYRFVAFDFQTHFGKATPSYSTTRLLVSVVASRVSKWVSSEERADRQRATCGKIG